MQHNDYTRGKGDLWVLNFNTTGGPYALGFDGCVRIREISDIVIEEGSNDGWRIESIFTLVFGAGQYVLATLDLHVEY